VGHPQARPQHRLGSEMTCELQGGKTTFAIAATEAVVKTVVITEIIETTLSVSVIDETHDVRMMFLDNETQDVRMMVLDEENYEMTMEELTAH